MGNAAVTDTVADPVTVIGLGEMGHALADALITAGHRTTVWNRTPQRPTTWWRVVRFAP